jgi:hypothetical protein
MPDALANAEIQHMNTQFSNAQGAAAAEARRGTELTGMVAQIAKTWTPKAVAMVGKGLVGVASLAARNSPYATKAKVTALPLPAKALQPTPAPKAPTAPAVPVAPVGPRVPGPKPAMLPPAPLPHTKAATQAPAPTAPPPKAVAKAVAKAAPTAAIALPGSSDAQPATGTRRKREENSLRKEERPKTRPRPHPNFVKNRKRKGDDGDDPPGIRATPARVRQLPPEAPPTVSAPASSSTAAPKAAPKAKSANSRALRRNTNARGFTLTNA